MQPKPRLKSAKKGRFGLYVLLAATSAYLSFLAFVTLHAYQAGCASDKEPVQSSLSLKNQLMKSMETPKMAEEANKFLSTSEKAELFYRHHAMTIQQSINRSTELYWGPTDVPAFDVFKKGLGEKLAVKEGQPNKEFPIDSARYIVWREVCELSRRFQLYKNTTHQSPLPHVAILRMNENWGSFSRYVENRTATRRDLIDYNTEETWARQGCTPQDILAYLNHPDVKAAVTVQHQFLDHPKVHSLPLGFRSKRDMPLIKNTLGQFTSLDRPQLLMINSNPHSWRIPLLNKVIANFYGTVNNTFGYNGLQGNDRFHAYLDEMRRS